MGNVTAGRRQQRDLFLQNLARLGSVTAAAAQCELSRYGLYKRRRSDPAFAEAWEEAIKIGTEGLEDEAIRRAAEGWLEPIYHQGSECGQVRKYSDRLLIYLLNRRQPEKPEADETAGLSLLMEVLNAVDGTSRCLPSENPYCGSSGGGFGGDGRPTTDGPDDLAPAGPEQKRRGSR